MAGILRGYKLAVLKNERRDETRVWNFDFPSTFECFSWNRKVGDDTDTYAALLPQLLFWEAMPTKMMLIPAGAGVHTFGGVNTFVFPLCSFHIFFPRQFSKLPRKTIGKTFFANFGSRRILTALLHFSLLIFWSTRLNAKNENTQFGRTSRCPWFAI